MSDGGNPIDTIRSLMEQGRFQEALDECRALLFEDPESQEVLALLREANEAIESGEVRPVSGSTDLESRLAAEFGADEEPSGADEEPSTLSEEDRERVSALVAEGEKAFAGGRYQEALDVWSRIYIVDLNNTRAQKLIEKARVALEEEQRKWDELIQEANDLLEGKDYKGATEVFQRVLDASPNHAEALDGIERVEQAEKDDEEKAGKTKQMMVKAARLFKEGQLSEAIYTWEKVLEIEPDNERARNFLREARQKAGEPVTGSGMYDLAPPPRSDKPAAPPSARSELLTAAYDTDVPMPTVGAARSPLPKLLGIAALAALIVMGGVYLVLNRDTGGLDDDIDVVDVEPTIEAAPAAPVEDVVPPVLEAVTVAELDKEIGANPTYDEAKKAFGEGRYEQAAALYKTIMLEVPDNPLVKQQLHRSFYDAGVMALRAGETDHAAELFSTALDIEPQDSIAKRNLEAARRYAGTKPDDRLRWYAQLLVLRS